MALSRVLKENLLTRLFRGEEPLWKAFWLFGVVGWVLVFQLATLLSEILHSYDIRDATSLVWGIYLSVAVWRCATNTQWRYWGYAARAVIIAAWLWQAGFEI